MPENKGYKPPDMPENKAETGDLDNQGLDFDFGDEADVQDAKEVSPEIRQKVLELKKIAETKANEISAEIESIKNEYAGLENSIFSQKSKETANFYLEIINKLIQKDEGKALLDDGCVKDIGNVLKMLKGELSMIREYEIKPESVKEDVKEKSKFSQILNNNSRTYTASLSYVRNKSEWSAAYGILKREWEDIASDEIEKEKKK